MQGMVHIKNPVISKTGPHFQLEAQVHSTGRWHTQGALYFLKLRQETDPRVYGLSLLEEEGPLPGLVCGPPEACRLPLLPAPRPLLPKGPHLTPGMFGFKPEWGATTELVTVCLRRDSTPRARPTVTCAMSPELSCTAGAPCALHDEQLTRPHGNSEGCLPTSPCPGLLGATCKSQWLVAGRGTRCRWPCRGHQCELILSNWLRRFQTKYQTFPEGLG